MPIMEPKTRPGYRLICRAWFTTKNGKRIYASTYGKKCFCFWVKE